MRLFLFFLLASFFTGCATKPVVYEATKATGHWETKALVHNLKDNKTSSVSIDFVAVKPSRLRAEVTGPMGISVATLVLNKDQIYFALHTQKKFYQGPLTEKALVPLFKINLNPRILFYVLFDDPLPGWDCRMGADGLIENCKSKNSDMAVAWSERKGESKRITIQRADFEVQVFVKDFSTKVQQDVGLFALSPPEAYTIYQLN